MTEIETYLRTATAALKKCAANDPWFPHADPAIVLAWAEHIAEARLSLDDVLAGVALMYRDNGSGFRPLPADLVYYSRHVRRERMEREDDRSAYEAMCDAKAAPDEPVAVEPLNPEVAARLTAMHAEERAKEVARFARSVGDDGLRDVGGA